MVSYDNNSSSSDDEDMKNALREATDQEFLQNSLFNDHKSETKGNDTGLSAAVANIKPSLRLNTEDTDNFESFGVTQSYKDFVAKKLYDFLERHIELIGAVNRKKMKKRKKIGEIKLLASSVNNLTCHNEFRACSTLPNKKKIIYEDSTESILKCQEVVVNSELIIAKTETKAWSERQKGTLFTYKKMSNGTLIEQ